MKKLIISLISVLGALSFVSCDDLFDPALENVRDENAMQKDPSQFDGMLRSAYLLMPYGTGPATNDVATDDAVTNNMSNNWLNMAVGGWTSKSWESTCNWRDRNASIQFCNVFLNGVNNVRWADEPVTNQLYITRLSGEAYALRAMNMYFLLQNYGGKTASGHLLGVPIWTETYDATTDMNVPRNTFAECMQQIFSDIDKALELLPYDYGEVTSSNIPQKYKDMGAGMTEYNRVFGNNGIGRISGRIAEAVRAQAALLAASPAFSDQSGVDWATAAHYAGVVLDHIGGVAGMASKGHIWYTPGEVGNTGNTVNHNEIIWRGNFSDNNDLEKENFPPSLYGNGRINPTQNLVDAFPMANGYPIHDSRGYFDEANPYDNRDPRLSDYIVYNGSVQGPSSQTINTGSTSPNKDGINKELGHSTRTGYYMRKFLRDDCNPNSAVNTVQRHYTKYIRYTEIFLAYAEAANEAYGPTGSGEHSYSAYDVIKAIRKRAGVGVDNGDPYLEQAKNNKEDFKKLIRNERRLELCFENVRFWDLRRWNETLNETARGVDISGNNYNYIDVEQRLYNPYMVYGPIPFDDVLKFSNLEQNQGW